MSYCTTFTVYIINNTAYVLDKFFGKFQHCKRFLCLGALVLHPLIDSVYQNILIKEPAALIIQRSRNLFGMLNFAKKRLHVTYIHIYSNRALTQNKNLMYKNTLMMIGLKLQIFYR